MISVGWSCGWLRGSVSSPFGSHSVTSIRMPSTPIIIIVNGIIIPDDYHSCPHQNIYKSLQLFFITPRGLIPRRFLLAGGRVIWSQDSWLTGTKQILCTFGHLSINYPASCFFFKDSSKDILLSLHLDPQSGFLSPFPRRLIMFHPVLAFAPRFLISTKAVFAILCSYYYLPTLPISIFWTKTKIDALRLKGRR